VEAEDTDFDDSEYNNICLYSSAQGQCHWMIFNMSCSHAAYHNVDEYEEYEDWAQDLNLEGHSSTQNDQDDANQDDAKQDDVNQDDVNQDEASPIGKTAG
jgi:hypothetical protein